MKAGILYSGGVLQNVEPDPTRQVRPLALPVSPQPLVLFLEIG